MRVLRDDANLRERAENYSTARLAPRIAAVYEALLSPRGKRRVRRRTRKAVCLITCRPYPAENVRALQQVRAAQQAGYAVDVVAMARSGEPRRAFVGAAHVLRLPVSRHSGASLVGKAAEYALFTVLAFVHVSKLDLRHRYKGIVIQAPPDFLVGAAIVPKLRGARTLFDLRDRACDLLGTRHSRLAGGLLEKTLLFMERLASKFSHVVITVHEPYRDALATNGIPLSKTVVVLNTLDDGLRPRTASEPPRSGFRIVYHGTISPAYGVEVLVRAFALLTGAVPEATLEIYGDGDHLAAVRELVRTIGIENRVQFSGRFLPHEDAFQHILGAAVGVAPNLETRVNRFALPTKVFDYVALAVPVVASDLPTLRAHFTERDMLFVPPGDAKALASSLYEIARDPGAARKRAQNALNLYEREYAWAPNARRFISALEGRRPRGSPRETLAAGE